MVSADSLPEVQASRSLYTLSHHTRDPGCAGTVVSHTCQCQSQDSKPRAEQSAGSACSSKVTGRQPLFITLRKRLCKIQAMGLRLLVMRCLSLTEKLQFASKHLRECCASSARTLPTTKS